MFSPEQVQNWSKLVTEHPHLKTTYCGQFLGRVPLTFTPDIPRPAPQKIELGVLKKPEHIFGVPIDRACLDGIGHWPIHASPIGLETVHNARVVGNSAVISDNGRVFSPRDQSSMSKQDFIISNAYGHQGFLLEDTEEAIFLYHIQRPATHRFAMDALFFVNIEPGNYGSFLFRQFPQMTAALDVADKFDCYIVPERTTFFMEAMQLLHLPSRPVFTTDDIAGDFFRSISIFNHDDAEGFLSPTYRTQLRRLVTDVVGTASAPRGRDKIYVSRFLSALRRPWYRVMQNELDVEKEVEARGFDIVYPETLSLRGQIRMFASASRIIGPSGSGMFNVAFAEKLRKVVDMETFHVTVRQHAKLYSSCESEYSFLFLPYSKDDTINRVTDSSFCPKNLLNDAIDWLLSE